MENKKRLTLNSEKRTAIGNVFQSHFEREESPVMKKYYKAKETYNAMRQHMKIFVEKLVRHQQPQEDVDTIRRMIGKYNRSGGELYEDNCFYVSRPITKVDDQGNEYESTDEIHVRFDMGKKFARAYYRDELKAKGLNPDYNL